MHVALANLLFEIIMVRDGVSSLPIHGLRDLIDDVFCLVFVFSAAFAVFIVPCMSVCHVLRLRFYNK